MNMLSFLRDRREGRAHSPAAIEEFVSTLTQGEIPDYQVAAWLMAAFLRPLTLPETAALTKAMAHSGEVLDLSSLPKPWVDKHSTGGVGDKTTIVLLPLLASCGLSVVKMSGRGLGITGGTVDKLASVEGFRVDLSPREMVAQAAKIGLALTGQTPQLAPADKVLYALRDATATIESMPLIASSILSKKMAGGAETIVLDVKCGEGAFMKSVEQGRILAEELRQVGSACGLHVEVVLTDMDQPLGHACGNVLEVVEAARTLRKKGPQRFEDLCIHLAGVTLHAAGRAESVELGKKFASLRLESGAALSKAEEWFRAQGANPAVLTDDSWAPPAPVKGVVVHKGASQFVRSVPAQVVGQAVVDLGGGRARKEDAIDYRVGVECHVEVGDRVDSDQPLFTIHSKTEEDAKAVRTKLLAAMSWTPDPISRPPLILT